MKPRTFKVNKHRSFQYYTPEDVAGLIAQVAELQALLSGAEGACAAAQEEAGALRSRVVCVGIDPGSPSGDRSTGGPQR